MNIEEIEIKEVREMSPERMAFALDLLNRTQGVGLFDEAYLDHKIQSQDAAVFIASYQQQPVSVGCAELLQDFSYYQPFDPSITHRLSGRKVGSLCTLSVVEAYQGKGIGKNMTRARMQWLKNKNCEVILGISWISKLAHTSDRVFEKSGFRKVATVEQFFKAQALKHPFDCPGCKTHPCICAAILYELEVQAFKPCALPLRFEAVNPLEPQSLSLLKEAFIDARALYPERHPDPDHQPNNQPLKDRETYLLGFIENKPVASGSIYNLNQWTGEIKRVYVHRDFRESGIGTQMLKELIRNAWEMGYNTLRLETGSKQTAAIRLYESIGFYRIPPFGTYQEDPISLCFELKLPLPSSDGVDNLGIVSN